MTSRAFSYDPDPIDLRRINIFIGLNGAGKSELIEMIAKQEHVISQNHPTATFDKFRKMGKAMEISRWGLADSTPVFFLIETVDEEFLRCFQLLVSDGTIPSADMNILLVTKLSKEKSHVKRLEIDTYGNISPWPNSLFGLGMDMAIRMAENMCKRQMAEEDSE